jgi:antitoxin HicB
MSSNFEYPASIEPDEAGRFLVRFPDLPEALTDGATIEEARAEAADCLTEALAGRLADGEAVPAPSPAGRGHYVVTLRPEIVRKIARYAPRIR